MRNFIFVLSFILQCFSISEGLFYSDLKNTLALIESKFVGLPQGLSLPIHMQMLSVLPGTSVIK